ncbi:hypothetical protein [Longispora fulva]|uniref:Uncharacterized protein n=1 Tax=Longispora fulva TaxID=619741 RepID=A0A8J7G649_9ACTN|nr:hypothetical protein [Longispora fulva]MBG6134388.1 hypothetical protein [Longispora fulva]
MIINHRHAVARVVMLALAVVLLADAAATYLVVTPGVTAQIGLSYANGLAPADRVAETRDGLRAHAVPFLLFALCYLALAVVVARRAGRIAAIVVGGFVALWTIVGQTLPWLGFGSLTNPVPRPGQIDWTVIAEAVPRWYAPTSLALFAAELTLVAAATILLIPGTWDRVRA